MLINVQIYSASFKSLFLSPFKIKASVNALLCFLLVFKKSFVLVCIFYFYITLIICGSLLDSDPGMRPHVATAGGSVRRRKQHHRAAEVTPSSMFASFLLLIRSGFTLCNVSDVFDVLKARRSPAVP